MILRERRPWPTMTSLMAGGILALAIPVYAQTTDDILSHLNRSEGLGLFHACEAKKLTGQTWNVTLCVPSPAALSSQHRSIMKPGVGVQAINILKELEQKYPRRSFQVSIKARGTGTQYGYAFRAPDGKIFYREQRSYE